MANEMLTWQGKYLTYNGKYLINGGGSVDSVSSSPSYLSYESDGEPQITDTVTITSSGDWEVEKINTGDGTLWATAFPISGSNGETCTVTVSGNFGDERSCIMRFTVGTANDDVVIWQDLYEHP